MSFAISSPLLLLVPPSPLSLYIHGVGALGHVGQRIDALNHASHLQGKFSYFFLNLGLFGSLIRL